MSYYDERLNDLKGLDGPEFGVLINKYRWMKINKPKTANEAFDMLYAEYEKQAKILLRITESATNRPIDENGKRL